MPSIYHYVRKIFGVGIGTMDLGFEQPQTLPLYDGFMTPGYMVRGSLAPQRPGSMVMQQAVTPTSLVGNGIALQGQLELQRLAQLMQGSDSK